MLNLDELALVWFNQNGFNFSKTEKILKEFDEIRYVFDKKLVKNAIFNFLGGEKVKQDLLELNLEEFSKMVDDELYKYGLDVVTFVSSDYPEKLKNIDEPPLVLYLKGDRSLLGKKSISIVGTRKPTDYGKVVCEKFTKELSNAGLVTISGLAYGIDTIVAKTTLECGGKTIAVLGGGLDSIYPLQNKELSERVAQNGLLISEYKPKMKPTNYSFVERNRIVSALGLGTLIVEAGKASGTMTTARSAVEQGRELFVVPGNINSPMSIGTNNLIDEMPDTFTISPERILFKLNIKKKVAQKSEVQVDLVQSKILTALSEKELSFDDLSEQTEISPSELSSALIKLEMFGLVRKGNGNTYFKI
jgi:DNA processing protein